MQTAGKRLLRSPVGGQLRSAPRDAQLAFGWTFFGGWNQPNGETLHRTLKRRLSQVYTSNVVGFTICHGLRHARSRWMLLHDQLPSRPAGECKQHIRPFGNVCVAKCQVDIGCQCRGFICAKAPRLVVWNEVAGVQLPSTKVRLSIVDANPDRLCVPARRRVYWRQTYFRDAAATWSSSHRTLRRQRGRGNDKYDSGRYETGKAHRSREEVHAVSNT